MGKLIDREKEGSRNDDIRELEKKRVREAKQDMRKLTLWRKERKKEEGDKKYSWGGGG